MGAYLNATGPCGFLKSGGRGVAVFSGQCEITTDGDHCSLTSPAWACRCIAI